MTQKPYNHYLKKNRRKWTFLELNWSSQEAWLQICTSPLRMKGVVGGGAISKLW